MVYAQHLKCCGFTAWGFESPHSYQMYDSTGYQNERVLLMRGVVAVS